MVKKLIKKIIIIFLFTFGKLFYEEKYLTGRFFDKSELTKGWFMMLKAWYPQKIRGINRHVPWPVSENVMVGNPDNIEFDVDYIDNFFSNGCYFQALDAKLYIGKRTMIAPGVGLITGNHDLNNMSSHISKEIYIGDDCWIGMNAVILPGVVLGDHTVVGAGAVVTKSAPEGYCILAGNPAKIIRKLVVNADGKYESIEYDGD